MSGQFAYSIVTLPYYYGASTVDKSSRQNNDDFNSSDNFQKLFLVFKTILLIPTLFQVSNQTRSGAPKANNSHPSTIGKAYTGPLQLYRSQLHDKIKAWNYPSRSGWSSSAWACSFYRIPLYLTQMLGMFFTLLDCTWPTLFDMNRGRRCNDPNLCSVCVKFHQGFTDECISSFQNSKCGSKATLISLFFTIHLEDPASNAWPNAGGLYQSNCTSCCDCQSTPLFNFIIKFQTLHLNLWFLYITHRCYSMW